MATINDYIYESILMEEMKLNKLSNQLGKIILTIYNSLTKLDEIEKYDNILKEMRVEMLILEKKFYNNEITAKELKQHFSSYIKAMKKAKEEFSSLDDKKINRALAKMDKLVDKLGELKTVM